MSSLPFDPHAVALDGVQLIEASAGTGKTWNICLLYLRLVLERGLPVRNILVMTFTKAATAELRERIRARLAELLDALEQAGGASSPVLARLIDDALARTGEPLPRLALRVRLALQAFDEAAILTIHAFCQRALGDVPLVAGVPLDSQLLADDQELAAELVRDFWRRNIDAGPARPALAAALLARGDDPGVLAGVLRRHQAKPLAQVHWPATAGDHETAAARAEAAWQALVPLWQTGRSQIVAELLDRVGVLHKSHYTAATIAQSAAEWDLWIRQANAVAPLPESHRLGLLRRRRVQPSADALRKGATAPDHPFFDHVEAFLQAQVALADARRAARIELLRALVETSLPALQARKRSLGVRTYDDLLGDLHAALQGPRGTDLASSLLERFPVALVDEFQDTDPLQWAILRQVYAAGAGTLFLVGDPKQAIYAFRNADLASYLAARDTVSRRWTLAHNQRAVTPLIHALNALFTRQPRAFQHLALPYPEVMPGARRPSPLHGDPEGRAALQVWLLPRDADGDACLRSDARALATTVCADEILRLLQAAEHGLCLGERALRAGDIAVLVRSHAEGQRMRVTLAARGVASVELSQANVFSSAEAEEILCVLSAVVEPSHAGRALAAAATVLLGYSARHIEELRQDEQALARLLTTCADALALWQRRGFGVMWGRLLERLEVAPRLLAVSEGARRLTNLRHLGELLQAAAATHAVPEALLRWLRERIETPETDESQQLRLDSDAQLVQIVTVHRAKGLEYPVVFCPGLWAPGKTPGRDRFGVREYHDAQGQACLDYRSEDELGRDEDQAIQDGLAQAALAEELRLIYVALTRASHRCYLVAGAWHGGRGDRSTCLAAGRSALAWLVHPADDDWTRWQRRTPTAEQLELDWRALAASAADPAALSVAPLPQDQGRQWHARSGQRAELRAAAPPAWIPARRRVASYSALVAGVMQTRTGPALDPEPEQAGRDHDGLVAAPDPAVSHTPPAQDILAFPRGAEAGTCLHSLLERVDFSAPHTWSAAVAATLQEHAGWLASRGGLGGPERLSRMLERWLADLAQAPLLEGLRLADLAPGKLLHELEFHLPVAALDPPVLRSLLAAHGQSAPQFRFDPLHGHLKGFIDLVFEHRGRWYVLDWKSNHLGSTPEDYRPAALQAAVDQHDYALQALIYLLALHRLLQCRLRDYSPQRHLGGALYLFVRGVRPHWRDSAGQTAGVWWWPADLSALAALADACAGRLTAAAP